MSPSAPVRERDMQERHYRPPAFARSKREASPLTEPPPGPPTLLPEPAPHEVEPREAGPREPEPPRSFPMFGRGGAADARPVPAVDDPLLTDPALAGFGREAPVAAPAPPRRLFRNPVHLASIADELASAVQPAARAVPPAAGPSAEPVRERGEALDAVPPAPVAGEHRGEWRLRPAGARLFAEGADDAPPPVGEALAPPRVRPRETRAPFHAEAGPRARPPLGHAFPIATEAPDDTPGDRFLHVVADDPPGGRGALKSILLGSGVALAFAAFAAVAWLAYDETVGFRLDPPLIKASKRPIKEPPSAPGGLDVANEDARVVDVFAGGPAAPRVERVLPRAAPAPMSLADAAPELTAPPPEPPRPEPPLVPDAGSAQPPAGATPTETATAGATAPPARPTPSAMPPAAPPAEAVSTPPVPPVVTAPPPAPPAVAPAQRPRPLFPGAGEPAPNEPRTAALPPPAAPPAVQAPRPATSGTWRVQLAAVGSQPAAQSAWRTLRGRHVELLGPLPVAFEEVRVGESTLFRVQAGAFGDSAQASALCSALRSAGTACLVVAGRP